jgi:pyruvate formate lyase activating enzyme
MKLFNGQLRVKMADIKGTVFNIKRFSVHDGPGIRTSVFLKGCPLKCTWCHNPEGIDQAISIWYNRNVCIACGQCVAACPNKALKQNKPENNYIEIDYKKCDVTGNCIKVCPSRALQFTGTSATVSWVMSEIMKDILFFQTSEGGVTITGGEPTTQPVFCLEILKSCKTSGIHTAIETCLFCEQDILESMMNYVDLFIVDMKIYDPVKHEKYTGKPNEKIKENLSFLAGNKKNILVRVPMIKNISDDTDNKLKIESFVHDLNPEILVEYLNFNRLAVNKYIRLGIPFAFE